MARNLIRAAAGGVPITSPNHPDLIAMYTMDNISGATLFDESPNGNDGTITDATAVTGHIGDALDFSTVNANVQVGKLLPDADGAVGFWADAAAASGATRAYNEASVGPVNAPFAGVAVLPNGVLATFYERLNTPSGYHQVDSVGVGSVLGFSFYVAQLRAGVLELYIDAVLQSKSQNSGTDINAWFDKVDPVSRNGVIGLIDRVTVDNDGQGKVDHMRLFGRGWTQTEITTLYNGGVGA